MTLIETKGWHWIDDSSTRYLNWKENSPMPGLNGNIDNHCVVMDQSGLWTNRPCDGYYAPSICSHLREWSNCKGISDTKKVDCGYPGITQEVNYLFQIKKTLHHLFDSVSFSRLS